MDSSKETIYKYESNHYCHLGQGLALSMRQHTVYILNLDKVEYQDGAIRHI